MLEQLGLRPESPEFEAAAATLDANSVDLSKAIGSLAGAVWGAILLVALPDLSTKLTDSLELSPETAQRLDGNLALAIFGLFLIIVMIAAPGGLQGLVRRITGALGARRRSPGQQ